MAIPARIGAIHLLLDLVTKYHELVEVNDFLEDTVVDLKENAKNTCDTIKDEIDLIKDEIDEWG